MNAENAITLAQNEDATLAQNEVSQTQTQTQAEFEAELELNPILLDIEDIAKFAEMAKQLQSKSRSFSLVAKSYIFTTSVEMVAQNASKLRGKEAEAYYDQNIKFTSVVGYFQGTSEKMIDGKRVCQTRWTNENLNVNFGVMLSRATAPIPIGTPIEIVYLRDEACKGSVGTVKIYDIFLLV